jgi:hypothetical protein
MQTETHPSAGLWIAAVALVVGLLVFGGASAADGPGVDDYYGPSTAKPAGAALDTASVSGERSAAREVYDQGWWSIEAAADGFVLVHHP